SLGTIFVTPNLPSVKVPVLSKTTAFRLRASSKFVRLRINNPFLAEIDVDTATTSGAANPNACGQVITITVTIRSTATSNEYPSNNQINSVANPAISAR